MEVYRDPGNKDLAGWRGPGRIVSLGPDPSGKSKKPGVRVAWQGGEDHVPYDQVRPFSGWTFWLSTKNVSDATMFRISRKIEDAYELWGRYPTILGTLRRQGHNVKAKRTAEYPRLRSDILELSIRSRRPCEGAVVGGGARGFPAVTSEPGVLWLVMWPYKRPSALQTRELRSHWGIAWKS